MKNRDAKQKISPAEVLRSRASDFMTDEAKLLQKYGLNKRIVVTFPSKKRVPLTGLLAVKLLKWSRAVIDTEFGLIHK